MTMTLHTPAPCCVAIFTRIMWIVHELFAEQSAVANAATTKAEKKLETSTQRYIFEEEETS